MADTDEPQLDKELEWIKLRKEMHEAEQRSTVNFGVNTDILLDNPLIGIGFFLSAWSFLRGISVMSDDKRTIRFMFSRIGFQAVTFVTFSYAMHQKIKKDLARYKAIEDSDKLFN